jgi:hypothetical protein
MFARPQKWLHEGDPDQVERHRLSWRHEGRYQPPDGHVRAYF